MTPTQITTSQMIMKLHGEQRDLFSSAALMFIHGGTVFTDRSGQQWTTKEPSGAAPTPPASREHIEAPERRADETQTEYAQRCAALLPPVPDLQDRIVASMLSQKHGITITGEDVASDLVEQRLREAGL